MVNKMKQELEVRDLYDGNKEKTGETMFKGDVVPYLRYYLTVVIFIQNSKGEFLIQHRSVLKNSKWSSTGGHPVSGESSMKGIYTEVKEEIGINLSNKVELFKTIKTEDDFVDLYYTNMEIDLKDLKFQVEEVQDVKWMSRKMIEKLIKEGEFSNSHAKYYMECLEYLSKIRK